MTTLRATISRDGNDLILAIPGPVAEHLDLRGPDVLSWGRSRWRECQPTAWGAGERFTCPERHVPRTQRRARWNRHRLYCRACHFTASRGRTVGPAAGGLVRHFSGAYLFYPSRRHVPGPLRAFIDFMRTQSHFLDAARLKKSVNESLVSGLVGPTR
jgi:hypothetical protein